MHNDHDCADQFVSDAVVADANTETIPVRGHCDTCGRELVECYDYTETIDRATGETLNRPSPEPVYQLRQLIGQVWAAAQAGEWRQAVTLQLKIQKQLQEIIAEGDA